MATYWTYVLTNSFFLMGPDATSANWNNFAIMWLKGLGGKKPVSVSWAVLWRLSLFSLDWTKLSLHNIKHTVHTLMVSQVRILSLLLFPSRLRQSSSTETENTVRQTNRSVIMSDLLNHLFVIDLTWVDLTVFCQSYNGWMFGEKYDGTFSHQRSSINPFFSTLIKV